MATFSANNKTGAVELMQDRVKIGNAKMHCMKMVREGNELEQSWWSICKDVSRLNIADENDERGALEAI